jgi:hypothetical protein
MRLCRILDSERVIFDISNARKTTATLQSYERWTSMPMMLLHSAGCRSFIENAGDTDRVFLEMFKADQCMDFAMNNWIRLDASTGNRHLTFEHR